MPIFEENESDDSYAEHISEGAKSKCRDVSDDSIHVNFAACAEDVKTQPTLVNTKEDEALYKESLQYFYDAKNGNIGGAVDDDHKSLSFGHAQEDSGKSDPEGMKS